MKTENHLEGIRIGRILTSITYDKNGKLIDQCKQLYKIVSYHQERQRYRLKMINNQDNIGILMPQDGFAKFMYRDLQFTTDKKLVDKARQNIKAVKAQKRKDEKEERERRKKFNIEMKKLRKKFNIYD